MVPNENLLKLKEASRRLGIHLSTMRRWLREGRIPGVKIDTRWRIPESRLQAYLDALPTFGPDLDRTNGHAQDDKDQPEGVPRDDC